MAEPQIKQFKGMPTERDVFGSFEDIGKDDTFEGELSNTETKIEGENQEMYGKFNPDQLSTFISPEEQAEKKTEGDPEKELEKQLNGNSIENTTIKTSLVETEAPQKQELSQKTQSEVQQLNSNIEKKELEVVVEYIEDSPFTPTIENLIHNQSITPEQAQSFFEKIKSENMKTQQELFSQFISFSVADKEIVANVLKGFSEKTENITEENFSTTEFANQAGTFLDFPEDISRLECIIAEHYISFPNKEGQQDIENDIQTALQTTTNTIIKKHDNEFKQNNAGTLNKIRTATNIKEQYTALQELYKADLKKDAEHLGVKNKEQIREKAHEIKREYIENHRELEAARESRNQALVQKLEQKEHDIIEQAKMLDSLDNDFHLVEAELAQSEGDGGMGGGKLDTAGKGNES